MAMLNYQMLSLLSVKILLSSYSLGTQGHCTAVLSGLLCHVMPSIYISLDIMDIDYIYIYIDMFS